MGSAKTEPPTGRTLGGRLQIARAVADVNQDVIAAALHTTVSEVSKWENDKQAPSVENLRGLSTVLGVSIDWLVHGARRYDLATLEELSDDPGPTTLGEASAATTREGPPRRPRTRGSSSRKPRPGESPEAAP